MARSTVTFQFGEPRPQGEPQPKPDAATPLRLVVLGDLSGRASRGVHEPETLASRRLWPIDIDSFDDVLARLSPDIHVPVSASGEKVAVRCRTLDEFQPDFLFDHLEIFASLRNSRRRLLDPATFDAEAARWQAVTPERKPPTAASSPAAALPNVSNADLLSQMLGQPPAADTGSPANFPAVPVAGVDLNRLVQEVVAPYVLPKADPRQAEFVAAVDEAVGDLLRRVLHARVFQAVEAAWRQLWRVTKALTGDGDVRLFVLDVTRAELAADLARAVQEDISQTLLYQLLVDQHVRTVDGQPWSALVVLEPFGRAGEDCQLLAALAAVGNLGGGCVLADAAPDVVGLPSWSQAGDVAHWRLDDSAAERRWRALRSTTFAQSIGLAAPRPLVRLPYGKSHPAGRLVFEEISAGRAHDEYLWGSAALGCAELIGLAFRRAGWAFRPGQVAELDDLPACMIEIDGESQLLPGAEVFLTDRVAEHLAARGLMPLLSFKNRHAVTLARFGSLSDPPAPLTGPWARQAD